MHDEKLFNVSKFFIQCTHIVMIFPPFNLISDSVHMGAHFQLPPHPLPSFPRPVFSLKDNYVHRNYMKISQVEETDKRLPQHILQQINSACWWMVATGGANQWKHFPIFSLAKLLHWTHRRTIMAQRRDSRRQEIKTCTKWSFTVSTAHKSGCFT